MTTPPTTNMNNLYSIVAIFNEDGSINRVSSFHEDEDGTLSSHLFMARYPHHQVLHQHIERQPAKALRRQIRDELKAPLRAPRKKIKERVEPTRQYKTRRRMMKIVNTPTKTITRIKVQRI